ncbi:MAG: HAD-IA family hydrolase [Candidatus Eiseniibacteriota bacterium]
MSDPAPPHATRPTLLTFDIFGTVVDWRRGLARDLERLGVTLDDASFERILGAQEHDEAGPFVPYATIMARSLVTTLGVREEDARAIGGAVGRWPVFPDAPAGLARLLELAPCVAMTNSDRIHREQVEEQLGLSLSDWLASEDTRLYKPDPAFWEAVAERRGVVPGPSWWHVSAYGDYDLATAHALGLTCAFIERPHRRPGPADVRATDLVALAVSIAHAVSPSNPE